MKLLEAYRLRKLRKIRRHRKGGALTQLERDTAFDVIWRIQQAHKPAKYDLCECGHEWPCETRRIMNRARLIPKDLYASL